MTGKYVVVGIDEVGRGCLAGPLVAAAVIIENNIDEIKDSKKLSFKKRELLDLVIREKAQAYGIGWTDVDAINSKGLTYAVSNAMKIALYKINIDYDEIIIDGNYNFLPNENNVKVIIKADLTHPVVSAASIIAKVYRDKWMKQLALDYPEYGFDQHYGYGTKYHFDKLEEFGPCKLHRMFYKPLLKYSIPR